MGKSIEIPFSKGKLILGTIGSIIFVILGILLFIYSDEFENNSRLFRNPIIAKCVGIVGVLFFGIVGFFISKKLFQNKVGLIINSEGITDHSTTTSVGFIPWEEINIISEYKLMFTKFLTVYVSDPNKYIQHTKGIKARLLQSNFKMYGTPVTIASNTLQYSFKNLKNLLLAELEKNKK